MFDINFIPAIPEIIVLFMTCLTLLVGVFFKNKKLSDFPYYLAQLTMIIITFITARQFGLEPTIALSGSFILDNFAILLKVMIYVCGFFAFLYSRQYLHEKHLPITEFYVLGLFSILGMMILVSAYNLLTLFLGLE